MSVLFGWQIVWWNTENFGDSQELANFDDITHPFGDQN